MERAKVEEICSVCNVNVASKKLEDGYICKSCMERTLNRSQPWKKMTVDMVKNSIQLRKRMEERAAVFHTTDAVKPYFEVDNIVRLIRVNGDIYLAWEDVIDFQLIDNGQEVNRGGLGGAMLGGLLFGTEGAVAGQHATQKSVTTVSELAVKIITRNELFPQIRIDLLKDTVETTTRAYRKAAEAAEKIVSLLTVVMDTTQRAKLEDGASDSASAADEIKKYKDLLDAGAITQEEFEEKKKQLMDL